MTTYLDKIILKDKTYILSTLYFKKYNLLKGTFSKNIKKWEMEILIFGKKTTFIEDIPFKKQIII